MPADPNPELLRGLPPRIAARLAVAKLDEPSTFRRLTLDTLLSHGFSVADAEKVIVAVMRSLDAPWGGSSRVPMSAGRSVETEGGPIPPLRDGDDLDAALDELLSGLSPRHRAAVQRRWFGARDPAPMSLLDLRAVNGARRQLGRLLWARGLASSLEELAELTAVEPARQVAEVLAARYRFTRRSPLDVARFLAWLLPEGRRQRRWHQRQAPESKEVFQMEIGSTLRKREIIHQALASIGRPASIQEIVKRANELGLARKRIQRGDVEFEMGHSAAYVRVSRGMYWFRDRT